MILLIISSSISNLSRLSSPCGFLWLSSSHDRNILWILPTPHPPPTDYNLSLWQSLLRKQSEYLVLFIEQRTCKVSENRKKSQQKTVARDNILSVSDIFSWLRAEALFLLIISRLPSRNIFFRDAVKRCDKTSEATIFHRDNKRRRNSWKFSLCEISKIMSLTHGTWLSIRNGKTTWERINLITVFYELSRRAFALFKLSSFARRTVVFTVLSA